MKIELKILKNEKFKEYSLVLLAYLAISIVMFWNLFANITTSTFGYGGDVYQGMWDLWWVDYALFTLHTTPYFTNMIFYPLGADLVTQTMAPLLGILTYPLQLISLPFALNSAIIAGIVLSGLFMYILAKYITGNKYASFIAGVIYAFSPEHIIQSTGHLQWTNIEFIPLFVLFLLLMIKEKKWKYSVYLAITFLFATFMGDLEQGALIALITFFILFYFILFDGEERKNILNKKFIFLLSLAVVLTFIFGLPAFMQLIKGVEAGVLSYVNTQGTIPYNILYSDPIISFFLPPYTNPIFGSLPGYLNFYENSVVDLAESVSYIGYSILFLVISALYFAIKKKELRKLGLWVFLAFIFAWLSLGPYVRVSGMPLTTAGLIPGIYLLYHSIPILNAFREPGRFDFATVLAIAVLAAFGFKHLSEKFRSSKEKIFVVFVVLILIEYWAYFLPQVTPATVPKAYYYIKQIPGNYSLLILPALPNYTSPAPNRFMGVELYYQTVFQKPLVGGYATRENESQLSAITSIPLVVEANYLSSQGRLLFPYPIIENYTQLNLFMLYAFNVEFVGVIMNAYNNTQLMQLASYLYSIFGVPVYQNESEGAMLFSTSSAIANNVRKHVVAYTFGSWVPGYYFCGSSFCNATFANMWWGSNARGIEIFVPKNSTHLVMNFSAMYYQGSANMGIYLNSNDLVKIIRLSPSPENYSVPLNLSPGLNPLILLTPNATGAAGEFNFGIMNITFSKAS